MTAADKPKRRYDSSRRQKAAAERRLAIVAAAREAFEDRGWSGTHLRAVAGAAGVSQKLVETLFGTKAALLEAAATYGIRGDVGPTPMPQRPTILEMERVPDAESMLRLHAHHLRLVNARSARIALVVEQAAPVEPAVAAIWRELNHNRSYGVEWACTTYLTKRGRRRGMTRERARPIFWIAFDWGTYRTLVDHAQLDDDGYERWLVDYYRATLLPR